MKSNRKLFLSGFNEEEPLLLHVVSRAINKETDNICMTWQEVDFRNQKISVVKEIFGVEHATLVYSDQCGFYSYTIPFEGMLPNDDLIKEFVNGVTDLRDVERHIITDVPQDATLLQIVHSHNVSIKTMFGGKLVQDGIAGAELSDKDKDAVDDENWKWPGVGLSSTDGLTIHSHDPNQVNPGTVIK